VFYPCVHCPWALADGGPSCHSLLLDRCIVCNSCRVVILISGREVGATIPREFYSFAPCKWALADCGPTVIVRVCTVYRKVCHSTADILATCKSAYHRPVATLDMLRRACP
jgi:hypothetical protein